MDTLIFIDTNIFLDFYRVAGRQADLTILKHLEGHHKRIITTSQVEMEFKKNRPRVIRETFDSLKSPKWSVLQLPAFLEKSRQSSGLATGRRRIDEQLSTLRTRLSKVFQTPTIYDAVYKAAQRLFRADSPYNLSRERKERIKIRQRAWKRFIMGYPPRKPGDTSMGDSINWEWIVNCAQESGANVVVVSRDSDFGLGFGDAVYINDWLRQEFRERVSSKRQISLTERLAEGLKMASIPVTKEEEAAEQKFLEKRSRTVELPTVPVFDFLRAFTATTEALLEQLHEPTRGFQQMAEEFERSQRELARRFGKTMIKASQGNVGDSEDSET